MLRKEIAICFFDRNLLENSRRAGSSGTRSRRATKSTAAQAQFLIAAGRRGAQHFQTMSDTLTTRLGTTTTGQLLVRSGIEIERILKAMVDDAAPMTAKLPEVMFLTRLLSFDAAQQQVMLAYSDHKPGNSALLAARSVTFTCNHRGAQFAFACTKPVHAMHSGQPAIRMAAPPIVLAMQPNHRGHATRLPSEPDVLCELRMGVISFEARLVDMSLDGKAFLVSHDAVPVCAGTRLQGVRVSDGGRPLQVDILVDQVGQTPLQNGKRGTRIGCRIVAQREQLEKIIKLFIIDLQ
jgi:c-di-GMP-binding flagellar brake protein YcgR